MPRTASRPVPSGRVSPRAGLIYGVLLCGLSFLLLAIVRQRARRVAWRFAGFAGYVGRLHDVAQAPHRRRTS